jgi:biopolymer transport protein ExbD
MRRSRYVPKKGQGIFYLNITSMTDMFTILLVFLLQTYSTSEVQIRPEEGLRLPQSNTQLNPVQGVKVSLSKTSLKFEDRIIAQVKDSEFSQTDIDSADKQFIRPLFLEFQKMSEKEPPNRTNKKLTQVLLQADADLPYEMIRKVFYTASMAGFPQMKIVTIIGN